MQPRTGRATAGEIELFYEDLGDPDDPPVMLIMGVGAQLPMWPDGFCERLIKHGYRVIRFDHRDTGLSTKMRGIRAEGSVYRRVGRYLFGRSSPVPYTLVDLADDVTKLLDHLHIDKAHVVGASMGGMIAQILAGKTPDRTKSLAVIMSGTGKPLSTLPRWRILKLPFQAPAKDAPPEERLNYEVRNIELFNGPNFLPPVDEIRRRVTELAERSHYPQGMLRQFDAILGTGSLLRYTRHITAPTVVIHGTQDPLVRPRNGRGVAKAIPNARFLVVDGMGHDLPEPVWGPIVDALTENFRRAHD
jgi:pimeloyl-ACP methyl ester carboxylesterase